MSGNACCAPGESCGVCKCGPGLTCVIRKVEASGSVANAKPFYNCNMEGCVCIMDKSGKKQIVETDGAYCECEEGYTCTFTKAEGPDAGKVFLECGNGCKCEIPGSNGLVILKNA